MSDHRRLDLLLVIMAVIAVTVGGLTIGFLYDSTLTDRKRSLSEAVRLQSQIIDWRLVALSDEVTPNDVLQLVSETMNDVVYRDLGPYGRLSLVYWSDEQPLSFDISAQADRSTLRFVHQPLSPVLEREISASPAWEAKVFSVSIEGHGDALAAFRPLSRPRYAVLALIDLSSIRAPFIAAGALIICIAVFLVAIGAFIFFAVTDPILLRLQEGEARFREMFNHMRSGAIVCRKSPDRDGFRISDLNQSAERIEYLERGSAIGRTLKEGIPWSDPFGLTEVVNRVAHTGVPEHIPAKSLTEEKGTYWRESYVYKLPSNDIVILFEDVTNRKQAEIALKESEARWRSIIEMQTVAIILVDDKFDIRFANKAAQELLGQSARDLEGMPFGYPLTGEDVVEIEIIRPMRGNALAEMRALPLSLGGEQQHLLFLQDVSSYKRAEGDLRKLFQAIEQSPTSVVITDLHGHIEYVNPKFTEVTGYTYAEVVGKTPSILKSDQTPEDAYRDLWRTITSGGVWRGEFANKKKSGEIFWELAAISPVRDASGKITHYVAVKEDITKRKATEEQLRAAQRLEVIGQLTGGIAHDFNNLLGIIIGNLELLNETEGLDNESRQLIADAKWSAERGGQLTHQLLAFARRQRLRPEILNLNEVVAEMTGLLRRVLGEKIKIREVFPEDLGRTKVDRGQLESALMNLVVNARDSMWKGGTVTISMANVTLPSPLEPELSGAAAGEYVMVSVQDTGVGMSAEVVSRIFEPFFTTKKVGQGSGLGLSMVYGFVRQSEGEITVDSVLGTGTTVKIFLPRAQEQAVSKKQLSEEIDVQSVKGETILIVEDDDRIRRAAKNFLRNTGYKVLHASDALGALSIIERENVIDLVFTDIILGDGIDGLELAQRLRTDHPGLPVLLTTGYSPNTADDEFDSSLEILPKPYRHDDLARKIRELLDGQSA